MNKGAGIVVEPKNQKLSPEDFEVERLIGLGGSSEVFMGTSCALSSPQGADDFALFSPQEGYRDALRNEKDKEELPCIYIDSQAGRPQENKLALHCFRL